MKKINAQIVSLALLVLSLLIGLGVKEVLSPSGFGQGDAGTGGGG